MHPCDYMTTSVELTRDPELSFISPSPTFVQLSLTSNYCWDFRRDSPPFFCTGKKRWWQSITLQPMEMVAWATGQSNTKCAKFSTRRGYSRFNEHTGRNVCSVLDGLSSHFGERQRVFSSHWAHTAPWGRILCITSLSPCTNRVRMSVLVPRWILLRALPAACGAPESQILYTWCFLPLFLSHCLSKCSTSLGKHTATAVPVLWEPDLHIHDGREWPWSKAPKQDLSSFLLYALAFPPDDPG